jgi:hypothetical protein
VPERGENFWIACAEIAAIGVWIFHRRLQALIPGVELDILQYSGFLVWAVAIYGWSRARDREKELYQLGARAARTVVAEIVAECESQPSRK